MKKIGFIIVKVWVCLMSLCPYWLLYAKSDFYFLLVYHVVRYRRKVVRQNLLRSFPEKDLKEIKAVEKRFYHNFCDMFVEVPKVLRMKPDGFKSRVAFTNPEVVSHLYEQGKNVFYAISHSGNWEWLGKHICDLTQHKYLGIYKKVKNPVFEKLMLYLRTYGCNLEMVESNSVLKRLMQLRDSTNAVLIVADQTSHGLETDYWTEFLHQESCWFTGLERIAKKMDYAVVFANMVRQGRGRYEVSFELVTDNPKELGEGVLMERYVRCVERFIEANPDNWLWSHKRWKHKRNQIVKQ